MVKITSNVCQRNSQITLSNVLMLLKFQNQALFYAHQHSLQSTPLLQNANWKPISQFQRTTQFRTVQFSEHHPVSDHHPVSNCLIFVKLNSGPTKDHQVSNRPISNKNFLSNVTCSFIMKDGSTKTKNWSNPECIGNGLHAFYCDSWLSPHQVVFTTLMINTTQGSTMIPVSSHVRIN